VCITLVADPYPTHITLAVALVHYSTLVGHYPTLTWEPGRGFILSTTAMGSTTTLPGPLASSL